MNTRSTAKKNPHRGSTLNEFLDEEDILADVEITALKRVTAMKLADLMKKRSVKKSQMAEMMGTSRAAVDRLLDPECKSVTLTTLTRAANALGRRVRIEFVPA